MTSNLSNFNNIFANLAESAYNGRPSNFPYERLAPEEQEKLTNGKSIPFDFSTDGYDKDGNLTLGGTHLPNNGIVYLQPDPTLHAVEEKSHNPGAGFLDEGTLYSSYQKGLLTDEKAGFNSYFVTDTPTLNADTKNTYLAIRGSDAISLKNLNDWKDNDAKFALTNTEIPQAKLAATALKEKIKALSKQAPNAKLNLTGHSLGTMVAAQSAAQLIKEDSQALDRLGNVVLFDGPDVTKSLKNMGLSEKQIKALSDKTTYYVNPFDMVSMLNRTRPITEQFGHVNYIVPRNFTLTFNLDNFGDSTYKSSHNFGEFQLSANGQPLVASESFHPEMLRAGEKFAKLESFSLAELKKLGLKDVEAKSLLSVILRGQLLKKGMTGYAVYLNFQKQYKAIVAEARLAAKKWDEQAIPKLQNQIRTAGGSQKLSLRTELLETVAQEAVLRAEDYTCEVKKIISDSKDTVQKLIVEGREGIYNMVQYLEPYEVEALLADFQMSSFWDEEIEATTLREADKFQKDLEKFSETLMDISQDLQKTDEEGADGFNKLAANVKMNGEK